MHLVLASKSPRRRELLASLKVPFRVEPSGVSEDSTETDPKRLVIELARRKAEHVARRFPKSLVLGADTVVVLGGVILGQPKDADDAYRMLYRLAGTTHRVFTGVAVVPPGGGKATVAFEVSTVRMKKLPIDRLLELARKNLDKAGAYAIQNQHDPIARVVSGSYDNVVGLPLAVVKRLLKPYLPKTLPNRRIPS
jgi:septum formation protein